MVAKTKEIAELHRVNAELQKANHDWILKVHQMNEHYDFLEVEKLKSPLGVKKKAGNTRLQACKNSTELQLANDALEKENHDLKHLVHMMNKYLDILAAA